jgi:hypothetical protein
MMVCNAIMWIHVIVATAGLSWYRYIGQIWIEGLVSGLSIHCKLAPHPPLLLSITDMPVIQPEVLGQ